MPLLGRDRDIAGATDHTAENFAEFFESKVDVRATTARPLLSSLFTVAFSSLASFEPCSQTEVWHIILQSPVKFCSLDPAPTFLVREMVVLMLPFMTMMVNNSLMQGRFPTLQKHAIITQIGRAHV